MDAHSSWKEVALKRLAVIPARGGSKRLPRKNILDFDGKPILAYTVEAALESNRFERVVVSTEDEEIAAVAVKAGAVALMRERNLATDTATINEVCLRVLEHEDMAGRQYEVLGILYATAPLRTSADIAAVVDLLEPGVCDFAMGVSRCAEQAHQALVRGGGEQFHPMWPDLVSKRESDVGPFYRGNGSTYAVGVEAFRRLKTVYGPGMRGHLMPRERSVDIDEQEDFDLALYYARRAVHTSG